MIKKILTQFVIVTLLSIGLMNTYVAYGNPPEIDPAIGGLGSDPLGTNASSSSSNSASGEPFNVEAWQNSNAQNLEEETPSDAEKGIRIDNTFKPINSPDAINQNYGVITINAFLQFLAGSIIEIISGIAIFTLVMAGYLMVTAAGNEEQVTRGKDIIKKTLTGLVVIILSYVIVKTILSLIIEVDTL